MNFKPTPVKLVISLFSGILINYLVAIPIVECLCVAGTPCDCPQPTWIEFAFDPVPIVITLVVIAIVYLVWSSFQK